MFDNLTDRLSDTLKKLKGQGRLTEDNIKETLREVRMALLVTKQVLLLTFRQKIYKNSIIPISTVF